MNWWSWLIVGNLTRKRMAEMGNSLEDLANVRKDLLLAEAAAWIHDMGKCDDRHIEKSASDGDSTIQYDYKTAHLGKVNNIQLNLLEKNLSFDELIQQGLPWYYWDTGKPILVRLLGLCHGVAHIEKAEIYVLAQQKAADTRLSTPFGHEFDPLQELRKKLDAMDFNAITTNLAGFKKEVKTVFSETVGDTRRPLNDVSLWIWSHTVAAFYKAALASVVLGYQDDLSKLHWRLLSIRFNGLQFLEHVDRIPDLLARQKILKDGLSKVRNLLEIEYPLGTEVYSDENGSIFIVPDRADLLELKDKYGKTLRQRILDAFSSGTIPGKEMHPADVQLGGEVMPNVQLYDPWPSKEEPWKNKEDLKPPLLSLDQQLLRVPTNRPSLHDLVVWWSGGIQDICSVCHLRPQGGRVAGIKALERKVCTVCEERREDRSQQWAENPKSTIWIDEVADADGRVSLVAGKFSQERWLDGEMVFYPAGQGEISAQVALKVRNMGGALTRGQILRIRNSDYEWDDSLEILKRISGQQMPNSLNTNKLVIDRTRQEVKIIDVQKLKNDQFLIVLDQILTGFNIGDNCRIRGQYFRVEGDGSQIVTTDGASRTVVEQQILYTNCLLVKQIVRLYKQAVISHQMEGGQTPARLSRVWETTQAFWESVVSGFEESEHVDKVPGRLQIEGIFTSVANEDSPGVSHTYELKLGNTNLSIVCKSQGVFLTVDNLRHTARLLGMSEEKYKDAPEAVKYQEAAKDLKKYLGNGQFDVEEPTGYGSSNKPHGKLRITRVEFDETSYTPAISILTEPRTFMALVPADKAILVVDAIKKKYKKEIGKVRNRLPLTVGVVFADRRTPLPAILDAGRRMLLQQIEVTGNDEEKATEQPGKKVMGWQVEGIDLSSYPEKAVLALRPEEDESPILTLDIPTIMGDGITEDVWYPYWRLEKERNNPSPRSRVFKGIDGKNWVHISDLQEGDTVAFMPSRLDFEFLDTASRRFEVSYDNQGKRRGAIHPARPYYLEQLDDIEELWVTLKKGLATSQIDNLVGLIETKRREWLADQQARNDQTKKAIFEEAVRQIISNAEWKTSYDTNKLVQAGVSGQLADVVELHMTILKEGGNDDHNS